MNTKLLCLLVALLTSTAYSGVTYFSPRSSEAALEFEARIELEPGATVSEKDFTDPVKMENARSAITAS